MTTELSEIQRMGQHLSDLRGQLAAKQQEVQALKDQITSIEQELLPDMFDELGISSIELANGTTIKLERFPVGRLTAATQEAAMAWLREHNHEGIIKNSFNIGFDPGDVRATELISTLQEAQIPFTNKEAVHPSTLKAFIREMADTENFPRDLFNVYEVKKVDFSE